MNAQQRDTLDRLLAPYKKLGETITIFAIPVAELTREDLVCALAKELDERQQRDKQSVFISELHSEMRERCVRQQKRYAADDTSFNPCAICGETFQGSLRFEDHVKEMH